MNVETAYAEVERITRREARNFAYGIMVLPRPKRRAIAAIYAFARLVDDIADGELRRPGEARGPRGAARGARLAAGDDAVFVALADARSRYPIPGQALHDLVDGGLQDTRAAALRRLRGAARLLQARRGRGRRRVRRRLRLGRGRARGDARRRAPADQHHPRRPRGLGARPRLPPAGRARGLRRLRGRHRGRARHARVAGAARRSRPRARARTSRTGSTLLPLARRPQRRLRRHVRGPLPCDT